jgi:hypothetical protein
VDFMLGEARVICGFYAMEFGAEVGAQEPRDRAWVPVSEVGAVLPFPETVALIEAAVAADPGRLD